MKAKNTEKKPKAQPKEKPVEVWGIMTCNSTRKALKLYEGMNVPHAFKDMKNTAPPKTLLREALKAVSVPKKLFNTSGKSYQEGNYKEKVDGMTKDEIIEAMVGDPMLIKRPLVRSSNGVTVGYDEEQLVSVHK